ncbi:MAG TPA: Ig-like domain-containing protein, partial [Planctomycetaceae bacterium]|nr:Ig-like domain-containing protein [Planctomycetaceae bacterium]
SVADGQLTLRLIDLGGSDPNAVINGLVVRLAGPDVEGPRVVSAEASGPTGRALDRVTLTFSEAIAAGTFTLDDVASLTGPDGAITPAAVEPLSEVRFAVVFPVQDAPGEYTLVVGPDILDLAGNAMDQDGDGASGEPLEDQFEAVFSIEPFGGAFFDFGTSSSAVESGYVRIHPGDTYTAVAGYGWLDGSVSAASRSSGTALTRDLNYSADATFAVDVPQGMYDVTLVMGDTAGYAHDEMAVFLEGVHVATIHTAAGQVVTNTFQASVADGQITLRLVDLGGSDANAVINGLDVRPAGPDVAGPRVIASDPSATHTGPLDRIVLDFSEAIEDGSFTLDDVAAFDGPAGPITPTAANRLTPTRYEIVFPTQEALGEYTLIVGPDILDLAGNAMDQDGDGVNGEPLEDRFHLTFIVEPFSVLFDFGTSASPVEPGSVAIHPGVTYSAASGFGWLSGSVLSANRSSGTPLTRDLNFSSEATFAVDVADGLYDVTLVMGDTGGFAHDQMAVFLEGQQVDLVNTAAGEVVSRTHRVSVSDGQLTLRLADLGGSDANAVINGLQVRFVGADTTGPRVIAADPAGNVVGSVDRVTLTFDEPLREDTFTLDDVVSFVGPGGPIAVTAINRLTSTQYEIVFDRQFATGEYALTIGPAIEDLAGNLMDQNQNGTPGEIPDDQFTAAFVVESFLMRFDFGTSASPVADGFLAVSHTTAYSAQSGHGWQSGTVRSVDRTSGTALTRDLNFTELAVFAVDVPGGTYHVTLTMGDTGAFGHDLMGVFLEGVHLDTVSTAPWEVVTRTYEIDVLDGQLTLLLDDLGGSDKNVVINGLELALVEAAPSLSGASAAGSPETDGPVSPSIPSSARQAVAPAAHRFDVFQPIPGPPAVVFQSEQLDASVLSSMAGLLDRLPAGYGLPALDGEIMPRDHGIQHGSADPPGMDSPRILRVDAGGELAAIEDAFRSHELLDSLLAGSLR